MIRILLVLSLLFVPAGAEAAGLIQMGQTFPEVPLPTPVDPAERAYLGLPDKPAFTLSEVDGTVVLVEILNVLCPHCQRQTGPYNDLFRRLRDNPPAAGRIRMLGVAVGNSEAQIEDFVTVYGVLFPVVRDSGFRLHRAIGGSRTPFSIYVRQDPAGGPGIVAGTHLGEDPAMDDLYAYLADVAAMTPEDFRGLAGEGEAPEVVIKPVLSPEQLQQRVRQAFAGLGSAVRDFHGIDLPGERRVFTATVEREGQSRRYFAEAVARASICDVCHDVHFIYVFDQRGEIVAFEPVHLTKYGNERWNAAEVEAMRRRVVGQYLTAPPPFDPTVDAVTRATMTSAIIFDQLARGEELMEKLRGKGLLK